MLKPRVPVTVFYKSDIHAKAILANSSCLPLGPVEDAEHNDCSTLRSRLKEFLSIDDKCSIHPADESNAPTLYRYSYRRLQ